MMTDTYSIICSIQDTKSICQENKLGNGDPGTQLNKTISTPNDNTNNNVRKVFIKRNISINDSDYYSFPTWTKTIPIIYATGTTPNFTQNSQMSSLFGGKALAISNGLSNNLTVSSTELGSKIILNGIAVYPDEDIIQMSITGPGDVYFGIGFNASTMGSPSNPAYSIVCDVYGCHDHLFQGHSYGTNLTKMNTVISDKTVNNSRTIIINRKRNITKTDDIQFASYYQFPIAAANVPIIYAIGQTNQFVGSSGTGMNMSDGNTYGSLNIDFQGHIKLVASMNLFPATSVVAAQTMDIQISPLDDVVNITLTGPGDRWFGVGFDSMVMGQTYSIICSNDTKCFEQLLGEGTTGQRFPSQEISTISDKIVNNIRTVKLTRKQIITQLDNVNYENFYNFPSYPTVIPIIYAFGTNDIFVTDKSEMANANANLLGFTYETNRGNVSASLKLFSENNQTVNIKVYPDDNNVDIVFNGPTDVWYGIGFNSASMAGTYAICVDSTNSVHEYILGDGQAGTKMDSQSLNIKSNIVKDGRRTVTLSRPALLLNSSAYNFPYNPLNLSIISAYGNVAQYNISNSTMTNATIRTLDFERFNSSSGGGNNTNGTGCKPGTVKYGLQAYVDNGFTVGLWIYCQEETIHLTIDYANYEPNWFGLVFNSQMTPSPNSTIFTTGKSGETRDLALYSYALNAKSISSVVYHEERDWQKITQNTVDGTASLEYKIDLSKTKWTTSTSTIEFNYAWGTSSQGVVLGEHSASSVSSQTYKFNLVTGTVTTSNDNGIKTAHGIIMIIAWAILTTIGIFSSRYRGILYKNSKNKALWFFVHRGVQCFVVILVLIGFGIAVYFTQNDDNPHFSNTHEIMGLIVVIFGFLQPINAWFRPHPPKKGQSKSIGRLSWEIIHKSFGYITWLLSQITIYLGIKRLTSDTTYLDIFIAWISTIFFIFICLWIYQSFCFDEAPTRKHGGGKERDSGLLTNDKTSNLSGPASPNNSLIGASERSDS